MYLSKDRNILSYLAFRHPPSPYRIPPHYTCWKYFKSYIIDKPFISGQIFGKNKVFRSLWTRLTKFSILGFVLAIISLILCSWLEAGLTLYFVLFTIILFIASIYIEGYGIYKTRKFHREDAQKVCQRVTRLIIELRTLAQVLHKDYSDMPKKHKGCAGDKRYKKLIKEFSQAKLQCSDYRLEKKLHNLIEKEKLLAKYGINTNEYKFHGTLDSVNQDIRDYIITRFKL
jgi:hypothetical protein